MKLNARQTMVNTIPIVDSTVNITVREICTVSTTAVGVPSYGTPPIRFIINGKIHKN